ncbi:MAG: hypothetical protein A2017_05600 [Lentisphaerae bacterium GWF2_44_16]|nr:MAG: hypothetical protein A2017_05600 [Lentisphaerae bacterium GWF2_44_16]
MIITGEMILLFLAIISALFSVVYFFWKDREKTNATFTRIKDETNAELSEIRKDNNTNFNELKTLFFGIRENYVRHDVCDKRRKECPCVEKMKRIEEIVNLNEK